MTLRKYWRIENKLHRVLDIEEVELIQDSVVAIFATTAADGKHPPSVTGF